MRFYRAWVRIHIINGLLRVIMGRTKVIAPYGSNNWCERIAKDAMLKENEKQFT